MCLSLGQRIMHFRKKAGLSQKDLAGAAGISLSALSRYETGKREPTAVAIMNLAKALGTTGDTLLGLEPRPDLIAQNGDEAKWLRAFRGLNNLGKDRALEMVSCLKELSRYTVTN